MKKNIQILFFVFIFLNLNSCVYFLLSIPSGKTEYRIIDNKVFWVEYNHGSREETFYEIDANANHFEILKNNDFDAEFGRDLNFIYYRKNKIIDADPYSFSIINDGNYKLTINSQYYAKDKNKVFISDLSAPFKTIINADPNSFAVFEFRWSRDSTRAFYRERGFIPEEIASFKPINVIYAVDNYFYYCFEKKLDYVDYSSFKIETDWLDGYCISFATDKYHVYDAGDIIENADPKTFVLLNGMEGYDKTCFYDLKNKTYRPLTEKEYKEYWGRNIL